MSTIVRKISLSEILHFIQSQPKIKLHVTAETHFHHSSRKERKGDRAFNKLSPIFFIGSLSHFPAKSELQIRLIGTDRPRTLDVGVWYIFV